ncbi:MAG: UvrD-helicase domain-containing protein, partial [Candidatus Izemoplasmatales bacterium]|nr:UvrD-helicase domain-containing protein [Candidatus Izemoplasmatales bacterium]
MAGSVTSQIENCLKHHKSFLLDAGAGSGKTWTLIETLKTILSNKKEYLPHTTQRVACITYTNVAKDEIIERIEHNASVLVSTIHEFLWCCIQQYQKELYYLLIDHVKMKIEKYKMGFDPSKVGTTKKHAELKDKIDKTNNALVELFNNVKPILYKSYPKYAKGYISHDDVIAIAVQMFMKYPLLCKFTVSCFPMILVDEYQDTQLDTIKILMDYLMPTGKIVLGFFGDQMQKIYDDGVGNLDSYDVMVKIQKLENYRCPMSVISLLNKIRPELTQIPGKKNQIEGTCTFYYGNKINIDKFISKYIDPRNSFNYKRLYLTHKFIAAENGYEELYATYSRIEKAIVRNSVNQGLCPWADFMYVVCRLLDCYNSNRT